MRILLAYSGGLDTSYLAAHLTREGGHSVTTCIVDCGGISEEEHERIKGRALEYGAVEHVRLDGRSALFDRVIRWLIAANVKRGQVYPLCVGAERGLQAELLAKYAVGHGFEALAHGCTSAGNDQIRFDAALRVCAPDLKVLAPIRDAAPARVDQIAWLKSHGLSLPPTGGNYSINAGLWGLTIGGGSLLGSQQGLSEADWIWTAGGGQGRESMEITIGFEGGVPVSLNGQSTLPVPMVEHLNHLAGGFGVGRGYHLGDTVLGIKGRIAFEAPAAEVLIQAHRELEKLVLTEDQRFWKDHLGEVYGRKLHQGLFHDPLLRDLEGFFSASQHSVCGDVTLQLSAGRAIVTGLQSRFSMMAASDAKYGESAASDSDPGALRCVANVLAEPARLFAKAHAQ
ncbi:MAG: argininosuccinate synthase [Planctomycetes bacterium]|nr:argininosuccinate synthase [Planctomycetota bacterium]